MREVAGAHSLGPEEQRMDRSGDRSGQGVAHEQCNQFDDEKQTADQDQGQHEQIAEVDVAEARLRLRNPIPEVREPDIGRDPDGAGPPGVPVDVIDERPPSSRRNSTGFLA